MSEILTALHAAIIDAPTDRTVRLVYADALDESGDPTHTARAEFIRKQIALETMSDSDPQLPVLAARCRELFTENWIDWWRPVCVAVGLPEPYVPTRRLRERVKRLVGREKRNPGDPYTAHPHAWSIESPERGFTAQFIAGFPELLSFQLHANAGPELFARWAAAVPLARMRFGPLFNDESGDIVDGPHLAKIAELTFDRLSTSAAAILARSPYPNQLASLKVLPLNSAAEVVRELVSRPTWAGLRSLTLTSITPPDAIQMLADRCTLEELETLSFRIREVPEITSFGVLGGAIGAMFDQLLSQFFGNPMPPGPIRWPDYWPALLALARSPVVARLRYLTITDADPPSHPLDTLFRRFVPHPDADPATANPDSVFPDTLVRALASGLNPDRLVRLELPAARVALTGRAELLRRFGLRLVLI